uniref:Uncharacterized protein n=1 Tax=Heterosigma akashiwo TaxID=2829 RepID=A0A7S3Y7L3_HETAK
MEEGLNQVKNRKLDPDGNLIAREREQIDVPTLFQCYAKEIFSQKWLQLGDAEGDDVRGRITDQNNNIALTAALMLTIQFALVFMIPDLPWEDVEEKWGPSFVEYSLDYSMLLTILSITFTWMAMLVPIMFLLSVNQLNGESEIRTLLKMLQAKSTIVLLMLGTVFHAVGGLYICFIFQRKWWNMIISIAVAISTMIYLSFTYYAPVVHSLYKVKHASTQSPPVVLSTQDIDFYLDEFAECIGEELLSPQAFERYVLEKILQEQSAQGGSGGGEFVYRALAYKTKKRLEKAVDKRIESSLIAEEAALEEAVKNLPPTTK